MTSIWLINQSSSGFVDVSPALLLTFNTTYNQFEIKHRN